MTHKTQKSGTAIRTPFCRASHIMIIQIREPKLQCFGVNNTENSLQEGKLCNLIGLA